MNFLWSEGTARFWRSSSVVLHQERNQAFLNSTILCLFSFGCKGKDQRCVKLCDYPPSLLPNYLFLKAAGSFESLGRLSNLLKPTHYWSCVHSVISNTSSLLVQFKLIYNKPQNCNLYPPSTSTQICQIWQVIHIPYQIIDLQVMQVYIASIKYTKGNEDRGL